MNKKIKIIVYLLLSAVIAMAGYIFFQELGHMIVMLSAGAKIYDFSIDVTNFLNNWSQIFHPLIVSVFAVVVIGISIGLMIKKRIIKNLINVVKSK